jgi:glycosyltransferase involved in cell wall biosynthesis
VKILQALGWYYPENLGGTEIYVSALSKLLAGMGHDLCIAAPLPGIESPRTYTHDGLTVYRYPIPSNPTRDEGRGRRPTRGAEFFRQWLADLEPEVAHFHSIVTGLGLSEMRAAKATGARLIFTSHASSLGYICQRGTLMRLGAFPCDGLTEVVKCSECELQHRGMPLSLGRVIAREPVSLSRYLSRLDNPIGTALGMPDLIARNCSSQSDLFATVDRFVVLTHSAADIVTRNGAPPEKLFVNPLGVSDSSEITKPGPETRPTESPVRLGYLGRFDPVKGVIELAEALRRLPPSLGFSFEFRGPVLTASDRETLGRVRTISGGDTRVTFAQAVPAPEVASVLRSYDALVCPSVCAEGGPTVALEAHSVGTPVVGTRIGGLAELVEDGTNGRLVRPGDVGALAEMLVTIIESPGETIDRWRTLLPAVRTMSDVADDYANLYDGPLVTR